MALDGLNSAQIYDKLWENYKINVEYCSIEHYLKKNLTDNERLDALKKRGWIRR